MELVEQNDTLTVIEEYISGMTIRERLDTYGSMEESVASNRCDAGFTNSKKAIVQAVAVLVYNVLILICTIIVIGILTTRKRIAFILSCNPDSYSR